MGIQAEEIRQSLGLLHIVDAGGDVVVTTGGLLGPVRCACL